MPARRFPPPWSVEEQAACYVVRDTPDRRSLTSISRTRKKCLSHETYTAAEKAMGLESLVALTASIGGFSMTCMTANTFGIDPPAANPTPLAE